MGKRGPKPGTGGRPRKDANPEIKKQLINYRSLSATVEQCAALTGIHIDTIYQWASEDENFSEEFKNARENRLFALEETLFGKALDGDTTSLIFALKTQRREKYAESRRLDVNLQDERETSTLELAKAAALLLSEGIEEQEETRH